MDRNLDSAAAAPVADPTAPATARRPRRERVEALLNTAALVATTVLLAAAETKLPRNQGD